MGTFTDFFKKFKEYDNLDVEGNLKPISKISYEDHTYFIGLKREDYVCNDLVLEIYNESTNTYEYYICEETNFVYIGYRFTEDDTITLSNERML